MSAPELDLFSAASWGIALGGSLHCVAMCGPLRILSAERHGSRIQYQGGRLLTYLALGWFAGYLGASLPTPLLGLLLILSVASALPHWPRLSAIDRLRARALKFSASRPALLGISSALLPCGLLHLWVAAAGASTSPLQGEILLFILWAGTLPALEIGVKALQPLLAPLRRRFPRALPVLLILLVMLPLWMRGIGGYHHQPSTSAREICH